MHENKSEFAGKTVKIRESATHFQVPNFGGVEFKVEDWQDRLFGESWMVCEGNPACLVYAMRSVDNNLPTDDEFYMEKLVLLGI